MTEDGDDRVEGYSVFEDETDDSKPTESAERPTEHEKRPASLERDHDRGCPKCGHEGTVTDTISTTGGGLSKFFDIQNRRFTVVSCEDCGYSELYRGQSSGDIVDVFLG